MTHQILTDITGTTSPNSFVKTLMQDFREYGASFLLRADSGVLKILDKIKQETGLQTGEEIVAYVADQIHQGNFNPDYLALNGAVNVDGYHQGRLKGEFFDDVPTAFQRWHDNGKGIAVYSKGSEGSQRLMFRTAAQGDLSVHVDRFFDTAKVGKKDVPDSYKRIEDALQTAAGNILFLSDSLRELDAANTAGYDVRLVMRPGNDPVEDPKKYYSVTTFDEL